MKILKTFGLILLALIAIVLILGLIAPKQVTTQQSTIIDAPQAAVFNAVNDLEQWPSWSPWNLRDTTMKVVFAETTQGAGAHYSWTSENSGSGQMNITDVFAKDSLYTFVEFDGQGNTHAHFYFEPQANDQTKVTWSFNSKFPVPFNIMLLFMDMKEFIDKDYAEGLGNLKTYVEGKTADMPDAVEADLSIKTVDFPGAYYLVKRDEVSMADMEQHFLTTMPAVGAAFANSGVEMAGPPSGLYYTWDEEKQTSDMALGIPAAEGSSIKGLKVIGIPATRAIQIDYYGDYAGTGAAHEAIDAYLKANELKVMSPVIERYITDPAQEPDPNKWLTEVIYLLEE